MSGPATIRIGRREIGPGRPAFLIAEVAQNHDGSLGLAHAFVEEAANAGADAVKFQTHIAAAESTLDEQFRVKFSQQDDTRYAYWRRMEFTADQWAGLAKHAHDKGIVFLSSAFSVAAVEMLRQVGMAAWKVGSGEVGSHDLIRAMAATGGPVLLSTGMSSYADIGKTVAFVRDTGAPLALFQCTSKYPTGLEHVGLNVIGELRYRFGCPVGLSDHSGSLYPALASIARGVDLVEVHFALDRRMFGPDVAVSLTPSQFRLLREAIDAFALLDANPVDKDAAAKELAPMRALFNKSVALVRAQPKGTTLTADMLTTKKPGTGIAAAELPRLIGRRLACDVASDRLLWPEDLE